MVVVKCVMWGRYIFLVVATVGLGACAEAQTISIDVSPGARAQEIDGFGTCLAGTEGEQSWWRSLYYDDLQCSILRMDLTPPFKAPFTGNNGTYNSPWYHNNPPLPGPEGNNVRTYTNAADYQRTWNGWQARIAVMGTNITWNITNFNYSSERARVAGAVAQAGTWRSNQLGDFKLVGSLWSPAPWLKVSSGNTCPNFWFGGSPVEGTRWPFIWFDNFAGGRLDTSGTPRSDFDDSSKGGSGPTSALTQFARGTAAYIRGFQNTYNVRFYAISIQNEVNFEEFYNSCTYPLSAQYMAALKVVRAEFDKYPDLAPIRIMGPEDLMGGDAYGMWQYGGGSTTIHKNLQYLQNIAADAQAAAAEAFFCIHGYAQDGVSAANATPTLWNWWANGWSASPGAGIPSNVKGFTYYGKKSWMTETSGENAAWLNPASGFPNSGAWSVGLRIHQALTAGRQSAWIYWQLSDGGAVGNSTLTDSTLRQNSPKYVAAKHFFRYIRPNSVRVGATVSGNTNLLASAYLHDANGTLTVVVLNSASTTGSATVVLPQSFASVKTLRAFTSSHANLWQSSNITVAANGTASISVPGYGVATLYGVASPRLTVTNSAPGKITVSWGQAALGFSLQSAPGLVAPVSWSTVTNVPVITNSTGSVTVNAAAGGASYYRLLLPLN